MPIAFTSTAVARAFDAFAPPVRRRLMAVRTQIFAVAAATEGVGELEETLKWGEPAYLTRHSGSGSTIRLGCTKGPTPDCALYFICHTGLVDRFRSMFPDDFRYEGNRAIVFAPTEKIDTRALALCIGGALTYHRDRKRAAVRR